MRTNGNSVKFRIDRFASGSTGVTGSVSAPSIERQPAPWGPYSGARRWPCVSSSCRAKRRTRACQNWENWDSFSSGTWVTIVFLPPLFSIPIARLRSLRSFYSFYSYKKSIQYNRTDKGLNLNYIALSRMGLFFATTIDLTI